MSFYTRRAKLPSFNGRVSLDQVHLLSPKQVRGLLARFAPGLRALDHARRADRFAQASERLRDRWSDALDAAALRTWGRPFSCTKGNYQTSSIGNDAFAESDKSLLRRLDHAAQRLSDRARVHAIGAKGVTL